VGLVGGALKMAGRVKAEVVEAKMARHTRQVVCQVPKDVARNAFSEVGEAR